MVDTNYVDSTSADAINDLRKSQEAEKASKLAQNNQPPKFYLPISEGLQLSDDVSVDSTKITIEDEFQLEDDATATGYPKGVFQVTDDIGGGAGVIQPARVGFCDCGA